MRAPTSALVAAAGLLLAAAEPNAASRIFGDTPVFFKAEKPETLMQHAPPFGYKFQTFDIERLRLFQANATQPAVQRFGSCAVVGNSGTLLHRRLGAEIDAHDAVLRVNHAPLAHAKEGEPYVPHAGKRTTWRVVTSRWFAEAAKDPEQRLLVLCDRPFLYSCQNLLFEAGPKPNAHNINPRFYAAMRQHAGVWRES